MSVYVKSFECRGPFGAAGFKKSFEGRHFKYNIIDQLLVREKGELRLYLPFYSKLIVFHRVM